MCLTTLILLVATFCRTSADYDTSNYTTEETVTPPPSNYTTAFTIGPVTVLIILAVCIYFCRRNDSSNDGFKTLGNEGDTKRNSSWKKRRFFRRNNRKGMPSNETHVHVHPVLQLNPSQTNSETGSAYHPRVTLKNPPSYDGHSNPLFMTSSSTYIPQMQPVPPPYV